LPLLLAIPTCGAIAATALAQLEEADRLIIPDAADSGVDMGGGVKGGPPTYRAVTNRHGVSQLFVSLLRTLQEDARIDFCCKAGCPGRISKSMRCSMVRNITNEEFDTAVQVQKYLEMERTLLFLSIVCAKSFEKKA